MLSHRRASWQPRAISGRRLRDCAGDQLVVLGNRRRPPRLLAPPRAAGLGLLAHGTTSHFADASPCGTRRWIATHQPVHTALCLAVQAVVALVILTRAMGPTRSRRQCTSRI